MPVMVEPLLFALAFYPAYPMLAPAPLPAPLAPPPQPLPRPQPPLPEVPVRRDPSRVCLDYLKAKCTRGDQCRFLHPDLTEVRQRYKGSRIPVCEVFVLTGRCKFGSRCIKMHPKSEDPPRPAKDNRAGRPAVKVNAETLDRLHRLASTASEPGPNRQDSDNAPGGTPECCSQADAEVAASPARLRQDEQVNEMTESGLKAILDTASPFDQLFVAVLQDLNLVSL